MRSEFVLTLTGTDRVGIVEEVTKTLLDLGGNVTTSRMARLGGEFAMLVLVELSGDAAPRVDAAFAKMAEEGFRVTVTPTQARPPREDWSAYTVTVSGADHEGIVHEIAAGLSARGITIESLETDVTEAPVSGAPLFMMRAGVLVPPTLAESEWTSALAEAGRRSGVDVDAIAG